MSATKYTGFKAIDPYFAVIQEALRDLVDGDHYFDLFADDAVFKSLYHFSRCQLRIVKDIGIVGAKPFRERC